MDKNHILYSVGVHRTHTRTHTKIANISYKNFKPMTCLEFSFQKLFLWHFLVRHFGKKILIEVNAQVHLRVDAFLRQSINSIFNHYETENEQRKRLQKILY